MSKKTAGLLLVGLGFAFVVANFSLEVKYWLPLIAIGIVLITIGCWMLQNQREKKQLERVKVQERSRSW